MRRAVAAGCLAAACLLGCESVPHGVYTSDDGEVLPEQLAPGLVAQRSPPLRGVPIPVGFVVVESKSRESRDRGGRSADHYYQGRAEVQDTIDFYRRELPALGWRPRGEQIVAGHAALNYTKDWETLAIQIAEAHGVATVRATLRSAAGAPAMPTAGR